MAVHHQNDLPGELRRLWRLPGGSGLGRPPELDVDRVVQAAVELADRQELSGVTLPKIATALGYTTMALYRHVGSKEELLSLMSDFAIGMPPDIRPGDWRSGLRQWAIAARLVNHQHRWLARLPISGPPAGPHQIAWMETAFRILRDTGLDWAEKVGSLMLISGYVRQATLLAQDLDAGHGRKGTRAKAERRYGKFMLKLIAPARFPETARLFASGLFDTAMEPAPGDPTADSDFRFGLERILDGIAVAVARRHPARRRAGPKAESRS